MAYIPRSHVFTASLLCYEHVSCSDLGDWVKLTCSRPVENWNPGHPSQPNGSLSKLRLPASGQ